MELPTRLEAAVLPISTIESKDGKLKYTLVLNYNAIIKAEELLSPFVGRDKEGNKLPSVERNLAEITHWQHLSKKDLKVICWAAFDQYHPEITLKQVGELIPPDGYQPLFVMLFEQAFPGVMVKLLEQVEKAKAIPEGETQPDPTEAVAV